MTRKTNVLIQICALLVHLLNLATPIASDKVKPWIALGIVFVQGIVAIIAHSYNPDGSSAQEPYDPNAPTPGNFGQATKIILVFLLCSMILIPQYGCGTPKPSTQVQQTPQQKALKYVDDIRFSGRTAMDTYMNVYRTKLAQLKADKTLTDKQRHDQIAQLNSQSNAINEIWGKSIDLEEQAGKIITDNTNFTGPPILQALNLGQQIAGLFNDPVFASIGDQQLHTIVASAQATVQSLITLLKSQLPTSIEICIDITDPSNWKSCIEGVKGYEF